MSRCARCGAPLSLGDEAWDGDRPIAGRICSTDSIEADEVAVIACRDRELSNLRALLRSVTSKLEKAHGFCTDDYPKSAAQVIESVLEALS